MERGRLELTSFFYPDHVLELRIEWVNHTE